jgi:hypothetical protein
MIPVSLSCPGRVPFWLLKGKFTSVPWFGQVMFCLPFGNS